MAYAPKLDWAISEKYKSLPSTLYFAEYIWIGGSGMEVRSKTKTFTTPPKTLSDFPMWNFDGSSTGQAPGRDSEVYLNPVAFYRDPFRSEEHNYIVLCECVLPDGKVTPIPSNTRRAASELMAHVRDYRPWFGLEQEYVLYDKDGTTILGWPKHGFPTPQGQYYCSVGTQNAYGRQIVEAHLRACSFAGLSISGTNAEVMPGQWEFQIGPCEGIDAGDQLWVGRYILTRICEDFGVICSFDPKPQDNWSGSGCHANYSTLPMRKPGGFKEIVKAVECLSLRHPEHMKVYGTGNERRLNGNHETAPFTKFSSGIADRYASIRIPRSAQIEDMGYFEDRRPASNVDPYLLTGMIIKTTIVEAEKILSEKTEKIEKIEKIEKLDKLNGVEKKIEEKKTLV